MSSKAENAKEKRHKRSLLESGEAGQVVGAGGAGGNGGGEDQKELLIPLHQFDLAVLALAKNDEWVEARYQNGRYEVMLGGARLGNVPAGNYEARLRPHLVLSARLAQVSNDPPAAKISVQVNG